MVTCNSHFYGSAPSLLPISVRKFQSSCEYHSIASLKFTQVSAKEKKTKPKVPPIQNELHINLVETQQLHCQLLKNCSDCAYRLTFPALKSYSSNAALYSFLITSYIKNNCPEDAVKIYIHMRKTDAKIDNFIIPSALKACCVVPSALLGQEVHGFVVKNGFHSDVFVCNALMMMYSEVGNLASACQLFDKIEKRDAVSWSIMLRNYSRHGMLNEALNLVREMHAIGVKPSEIAMISIIHVIAELADMKLGKGIHAYVTRNMSYEKPSVPLSTALIDLYAKCANLAYARRIFDNLSAASIISWTAMIAAYIHCNDLNEGFRLFIKILVEGVFPNDITILSLVKGCGAARALKLGKLLHAFTLRNGIAMSLNLATAFLDMYGKCSDVRSARSVFNNSTKNKDLMMYSAMISAYAKADCIDEAFDIFAQMTGCGIKPNEITMVSLLSLCAKSGSLEMGKWIHSYLDKQGIKADMVLKTSLVDMYSKCGDIDTAYGLFIKANDRDISMWNAMISGFAMHGHGNSALELFAEMEAQGVIPNDITFIAVLHACSHAGLVQEGKRLFCRMVNEFSLVPKIEHYGCMVDLLSRAGSLEEAQELIKDMPMRPNSAVLGSFLAACKVHKNVNLAEWAAKQFLSLEPEKCGYNVLMSNIWAASNRWENVADIRRAMKDAGIHKEPGFSSIEVHGTIHEFVMGDREHPETPKIYEMIGEMREKLEHAGYTPNVSVVLKNIDMEEKESAVNYHSEKLAMAYGLISTGHGIQLRILKNLRICEDCHNATKLVSKIYGREIIVRDRNRFHHFKEGFCSCNEYW
ncbi:hypothetical protein HN51_027294 [Arachis hypogaea]|uniref:DYW domain-containing protein n=1 Tax=Arachis hypogaea TaxID=3818 RepID=A0A445BNM6_ARAHY|nr:pentatricopeptide repeat-containing protein At2g02980, chloroplastic-like [Arachis hypogaea]QHO33622.1 Pentatricopeptide repeat-containing protein [Arachis hypogaea]RYR40277.1 hypothetical protein Ahy_A09g046003 [Arachis hypogaea]